VKSNTSRCGSPQRHWTNTWPSTGRDKSMSQLWVGRACQGSSRVIVVPCIISFPAFFSRHCGEAARNMKCRQLSCYNTWLLPTTPSVLANFRRTAVNKKRCVANTAIVTRISPYMPLLFQLVAPIKHPQTMRGLRRTKCYIFLGGSSGIDSVLLTEGSIKDSETML